MEYWERLKDLREDADLKQKDVAKILGTTQQQYNRYENNERDLPIYHYITLAKHYNVSLDYLTGLIPTPRQLYDNKTTKEVRK